MAPDRCLGADIDATGRVGGDQQDRIAAHLAADDQLLLIASGQCPGQGVDAGGTDVVVVDDPLRVLAGAGPVDPWTFDNRRPRLVAEDAVFPERRVEQQPVTVPVLGDVADAGLAELARMPVGDILGPERDRAGGGDAHPHDGLDELRLAIALDAGDAEDLALADRERDVREEVAAEFIGQRDVLQVELDVIGDGRLGRLRRGKLRPDHELGELALGRGMRVSRAYRRATAHDGDVIGDREDFVELVRDEEDRVAVGLELTQVVEQGVDLLRNQDSGRLVEDDDAGAAIEHLGDLEPLPVGDTELLDQHIGLEAEAEAFGDRRDLGAGAIADAM